MASVAWIGALRRMALVALIGALVLFVWNVSTFDESKQAWSCCCVSLPLDSAKLTFCQRPVHPYLAEYRRSITLELPDAQPKTSALPINPGGRTSIDVYWVVPRGGGTPLVLLREDWGEYLLDVQSGCLDVIVRVGADQVFAGPLLWEDVSSEVSTDSAGKIAVRVNGKEARDVTQLGIDTHQEYLGRIEDRGGGPAFDSTGAPSRQ